MTAEAIRSLVKAQTEMERARAGHDNLQFRSKYADLGDVQSACLPALHANGFAVLQPLGRDADGDFVDTVFLHETGWETRGRAYLRINKNDMQGYGSAVTYARRYGLAALAGITDEDDDGNAAATAKPCAQDTPPRSPAKKSGNPPQPSDVRQTAPENVPPDPRESEPTGVARVLTQAEGTAIVAGINACSTIARLDEYEAALKSGPNAFAAGHPKIRVAIAERRRALAEAGTPFDDSLVGAGVTG